MGGRYARNHIKEYFQIVLNDMPTVNATKFNELVNFLNTNYN